MKLKLFDYNLPNELIAQKQMKPRDISRLMVINKASRQIRHDYFFNLDKYLKEGDVLVFNNSKVFPARIRFGGREIFLLKELRGGKWEVMGRNLRFMIYDLGFKSNVLKCEILKKMDSGNYIVRFNLQGKKFREWLEKYGETPLPPYIKTKDSAQIRKDYQTVFAKSEGSVAAPTAGLHFTKRVFGKLEKKGIKIEFVTLHVGAGTFQTVKTENIEEHKLHEEWTGIDKITAGRLSRYKKEGRRIIAVGTTSCRALEALVDKEGRLKPAKREVNIFIYPGYKFKFVDGLITNFHLPKSSLLMLVSALAGRKFILEVYKKAIQKKYRFYSFGDGMFIR